MGKNYTYVRREDAECLKLAKFLQEHHLDYVRIASEIPTKNFGVIKRLQKEGWRSGEPDFFLAMPVKNWAGLWLEMKSDHNHFPTTKSDQHKILLMRAKSGYASFCCRSGESAIKVVEGYLNNKWELSMMQGKKELIRCYNKY